MSKNTNNSGKGDKPRNCFSKQYKDNFEKIDWKKEIKNWQARAIEIGEDCPKKYENQIDELISSLLGEKDPIYLVTIESKVGHFMDKGKISARIKKLMKKYNLKTIDENDYVVDIAAKMYNFRPF